MKVHGDWLKVEVWISMPLLLVEVIERDSLRRQHQGRGQELCFELCLEAKGEHAGEGGRAAPSCAVSAQTRLQGSA